MVRLIMLGHAVSEKVLQDVCVCVWVCGGCVGGWGGACTLPGHYISSHSQLEGSILSANSLPILLPSVLPSPHLLAFQLL